MVYSLINWVQESLPSLDSISLQNSQNQNSKNPVVKEKEEIKTTSQSGPAKKYQRKFKDNRKYKKERVMSLEEEKSQSAKMALDFKGKENSPNYLKMRSVREKLPAYKHSAQFLSLLKNENVIVLVGETGCGKSTQVR